MNEKAKEAGHKAKEVAHDAKVKGKELGHDAKVKAKEVGRDVNAKANETANDISENRDNPVVIGNAVIIGLGSIALGYCSTSILLLAFANVLSESVRGRNTRLASLIGK